MAWLEQIPCVLARHHSRQSTHRRCSTCHEAQRVENPPKEGIPALQRQRRENSHHCQFISFALVIQNAQLDDMTSAREQIPAHH